MLVPWSSHSPSGSPAGKSSHRRCPIPTRRSVRDIGKRAGLLGWLFTCGPTRGLHNRACRAYRLTAEVTVINTGLSYKHVSHKHWFIVIYLPFTFCNFWLHAIFSAPTHRELYSPINGSKWKNLIQYLHWADSPYTLNKKPSHCLETARRENLLKIAEIRCMIPRNLVNHCTASLPFWL